MEAAKTSYEESSKRLKILADPFNVQAQRDLAVLYFNLGEMNLRHGEKATAVRNYRDSLEINEALAEADRDNVIAQIDLVRNLWKLGQAESAQGDMTKAADSLRQALSRLRDLERTGKLNDQPKYQRWIGEIEAELSAATQPAAEKPTGGRES